MCKHWNKSWKIHENLKLYIPESCNFFSEKEYIAEKRVPTYTVGIIRVLSLNHL